MKRERARGGVEEGGLERKREWKGGEQGKEEREEGERKGSRNIQRTRCHRLQRGFPSRGDK